MDITFLQTVVPSGLNCITEIHKSPSWARNNATRFDAVEHVTSLIRSLQSQGVDTYFALASFAALNPDGKLPRTQDNVVAVRSFWLDIDAGAAKVAKHGTDHCYVTQQEAIVALYDVLAKGSLPAPTYVVSSGEGLHVYWCAVEDISPAEWRPLAKRLGQYCKEVGLKVDPSRTADPSSVLRPVGTIHFASGNTVSILQTNALFTKTDLLYRMGALPVQAAPQTLTAATLASMPPMPNVPPEVAALMAQSSMAGLAEYPPASFGKIIDRSRLTGDGCRQLLHIYDNQETTPEPEWYAGLTVAAACMTDRDEWIHKISAMHPEYSPEATIAKAAQSKGPMTCEQFEERRPGGCAGCPHRGRIVSPIVLGYNPEQRPTIVIHKADERSEEREYLIPELPLPFKRGANGGVTVEVPKLDDFGKPIPNERDLLTVVPNDFYIHERVDNGDGTQSFLCRYHSPHDGVIEFAMPSSCIHSLSKEFKDVIVGAGLPVHGKEKWGHLVNFLNLSRDRMVSNRAAVKPVTQLGWQPDGKSFVIGDTMFTASATSAAPMQDRTIARKYAKVYRPSTTGTAARDQLDDWNEILQEMYGNPHAVANQFVVATAFGAPFSTRFAIDNHAGGIISLSSSGSGHGKTFTCQTALRVWGDPTSLTFSSKGGTTANAFMTTLGYINSTPILRDEITEMDGDEISGLAYDSTRLADKERAEGSKNDIRDNQTHWRTFFYCTGNTSMYDMVSLGRDAIEGPLRRITEIHLPKLKYLSDTDHARRLAKRLSCIHGVAGRRLMEWFVRNEGKAEKLWEETMTYFIKTYGATNEERYWVNHLVSGCVGALIAQHLDLLPFDPMEIINYAGSLLLALRTRMGYRRIDHTDYLSQFFTENTDHTLMVGNAPTDSETTITVMELPRKAVYIRVEQNQNMVFINAQLIKKWCAERRITLEDFEHELRRRGGVSGQHKRMLANTQYATTTAPQKVWRIPIGGLSDDLNSV